MDLKNIITALNGLWLIEESQGVYWADMAFKIMVEKSMSAVPGAPNKHNWFSRVDSNANFSAQGPVLLVTMDGPLMQSDYCGSPGMWSMEQAINAAQKDDSVQSIILWIDSPGGTVAGTENLANAVKASNKPVVAFGKQLMASAAYWIGSSASEVIMDAESNGYNSLIGSIGTKAMWLDRSKEMEQKGWKVVSVYADKSTRKGAYNEELDKGDFTRIKSMLNAINETFHSAVKANRGDKLVSSKEDVFAGDVYTAKQAMHLGLIDKMADFNYAVKRSLQLAKTLKAA